MPLTAEARAALGANIRAARKAAGLKGHELAARLPQAAQAEGGCDKRVVSQWESGARTPSIHRLADIAAALGVGLSELVDGVPVAICEKVQRGA